MRYGYTALSLRRDTIERIRAFQILAIAKRRKIFTISEAIDLALEVASDQLRKEN
jgi:hypothetical protein